ncbi:DUF4397 domain-containing protein [Phytoactinopolyspora alkaliphila]|uniref:DUF4397 domain-containing protein n=1 Tax=Phytoactinopolyspora alkaliphila TaxID=1783498 RepID=A0A6N9YS35_9ACTN|nr:DUF4397 domain-containing protein [Phytoactinopolyspora alkaliphila]NED97784.1 DUF4397 domain-containing protein [Phytoactinopolyspora alkaliphila]
MRRGIAAIAVSTPLAVALAATGAGAQPNDEATVSVLHAVPGLTVDVYANGDELIPDFEPGTLTDPLSLPAGTYDIAVFADGDGPEGDPAIDASGVEVPAGANATIVAHLDEGGAPTASVFVNDTGDLAAGKARVTVRHTAAAPEVDVRVNETPTFEGLANPDEATADVDAGSVSADVVLAGTDDVVLGPADLNLAEGTSTIVYAWGSAEDENLDLAVQTIDGLHGAPDGVPSGEAGLLDSGGSAGLWWGVSAAALLGVVGLSLFHRRRSSAGHASR